MQQLNVAFYEPSKTALQKCDLSIKSHALPKMIPHDEASIYKKVFCNAATIQDEVFEFKSSGSMPINPSVFGEENYVTSDYLFETTTLLMR